MAATRCEHREVKFLTEVQQLIVVHHSTSPSVYFAVKKFIASDFCSSQIGPVLNSTFAVRPERLSTARFVSVPMEGLQWAHFTGLPEVAGWYPRNLSDYLSCSVNNNQTIPLGFTFPSLVAQLSTVQPGLTLIWDPCQPFVGFPTEILQMAPEWSGCTTSSWPLWDPPYALTPEARLMPEETLTFGPTPSQTSQ